MVGPQAMLIILKLLSHEQDMSLYTWDVLSRGAANFKLR